MFCSFQGVARREREAHMEVTWDVQQMFTNRHQGAFEKKEDVALIPRD